MLASAPGVGVCFLFQVHKVPSEQDAAVSTNDDGADGKGWKEAVHGKLRNFSFVRK